MLERFLNLNSIERAVVLLYASIPVGGLFLLTLTLGG